jgi:hypothetical protein
LQDRCPAQKFLQLESIEHPLGITNSDERIRAVRYRPSLFDIAVGRSRSGHPHHTNPNGRRHFFKERNAALGVALRSERLLVASAKDPRRWPPQEVSVTPGSPANRTLPLKLLTSRQVTHLTLQRQIYPGTRFSSATVTFEKSTCPYRSIGHQEDTPKVLLNGFAKRERHYANRSDTIWYARLVFRVVP